MSDRDSARDELAAIAASLRAHLEWHEGTGTTGLPASSSRRVEAPRAEAARGSATPGPAPARHMSDIPATLRAAIDLGPSAAALAPPAVAAITPAAARGPSAAALAPPAVAAITPAAARGPSAAALAPPAVAAITPAAAHPKDDDRKTRLTLLAEEVRSCTRCGLHAGRKNTVFARGNPFSELVFIGEGPGADEDQQGEPFVGRAGQLLDKMIAAMGYRRDDVYICNIVKCRPPENRKPEPNEMEACTPYLTQQLAWIEPKAIVALGATAVQGLIGTSEGITRMRGKWKLYKGRVPIMPTFHPAYLLRQPGAKREVWSDLQEVMRVLGKAPKPAS